MATPALAAIGADNPALSQEHDAFEAAVVPRHDWRLHAWRKRVAVPITQDLEPPFVAPGSR